MKLTQALLDEESNNNPIWSGLKKLNKIRNNIAHNLKPEFSKEEHALIELVLTKIPNCSELIDTAKDEYQKIGFVLYVMYTELVYLLKFDYEKSKFSLLAEF